MRSFRLALLLPADSNNYKDQSGDTTMAVFASKINTSSETYLKQRGEMLELVDKLNELNALARGWHGY